MSLATICLSLLLAQAPPGDYGEIFRLASRTFEFPLHTDPARSDTILTIHLWASRDKGLTWTWMDSAPPTQNCFRIKAAADGLYWFTVQVIGVDGKAEPERPGTDGWIRKVVIETKPVKRDVLKPQRPGP